MTRQSILFAKRLYAKRMDPRIIRASTPVFDGLCPRVTVVVGAGSASSIDGVGRLFDDLPAAGEVAWPRN
jgi:hypothetical protein